jgi:hypothetical protein
MGYLIDIMIGAAGSLVAAELWSHADLTAQWLIRKAVRRLPAEHQERRREEWLADLHDMPGVLRKLLWAAGCHWAATVANVRAWRTTRNTAVKQAEKILFIEDAMMTSDIAWLRSLNGATVVFCEFLPNDRVAVSVDGRSDVLDRTVWKSLPIWSGRLPFPAACA